MIADEARAYTDRKLNELEKELERVYARAKAEIVEQWNEFAASFRDREKPFIRAILDAEHGGDEKAIKRAYAAHRQFLRENTLQNSEYKRLADDISAKLANIDKTAHAMVNHLLPDIYAMNYNALPVPEGFLFNLLDPKTVENLLFGKFDLLADERWNRQRLNAEILQGILQGESMPKIAKRLAPMVDGNEAAAIRNARTAVTFAENKGRLDSMIAAEEECGLVYEKQWIATHDRRTRESHLEADGEIARLEDEFSNGLQCPGDPHGDPAEVYNCRCTMNRILMGVRRKDGTFKPWFE